MSNLDYVNAISKRIWGSEDKIPNEIKIGITNDPVHPECVLVVIHVSLDELNNLLL